MIASPDVPQVQEPPSALWTASDVTQYLLVSRSTLYRLSATGELPAVRIGRSIRWRPESVRAWLNSRERRAR